MPKRRVRAQPSIGSDYVRVYKGDTFKMLVVADGPKLAYRVGEADHASPSAAAKAITKTEVNGWTFWRME